jgi:hypothetical protein
MGMASIHQIGGTWNPPDAMITIERMRLPISPNPKNTRSGNTERFSDFFQKMPATLPRKAFRTHQNIF